MKIKQLNLFHWMILALFVMNAAVLVTFPAEKAVESSYNEIIYPPNLVSIILIGSAEYVAFIEAKEKEVVMRCYELGPFSEKEYVEAVKHRLLGRKLDVFLKTDTEREKIGYWVFLEPERSKALGRLKVEEVKLLGLNDVVLLTQNNPRYAISLGFFKDEGFANRRLLEAQSLGLAAKTAPRYKYEDYQWLMIKTTDKNDLPQHEWLGIVHEYQNIELKTVNCQ